VHFLQVQVQKRRHAFPLSHILCLCCRAAGQAIEQQSAAREVSYATKLKVENAKQKRLLADQMLDNVLFKDLLR